MKKNNVLYLETHQYDLWNEFVENSPQGDVFCYSWWLDVVTRSDFKILVIKEQDEIVAGIPLPFYSQKRINEPYLTRTLGVLYKAQDHLSYRKRASNERKWLTALLEHVPLENFVQMCMHHNFTDWLPFRWKGYKQTTRYTYIINYERKSKDDLWKNLNRGRKESINKVIGNGIRVEITDDFYVVYKYQLLSYERQGLKFPITYNDLKLLDDAINKRKKRIIFKAFDNKNQVHAVLYVVFNSQSAYALLSGSDVKYRKMGGHTLVMWYAIIYFSNKVNFFNFGGSDIERIENHLRGFGGIQTPYLHIFNENLIWKRDDWRYHFEQVTFHLKKMTQSIRSRLLGKVIK